MTDLRHALRLLARSPVFTATAVLSIAIGVAASTTIVGIADALLRQAPGVAEPDRVVHVARTTNGDGFGTLSYPAFEHLRDGTETLEALAATTLDPVPIAMRVVGDDAAGTAASASERVYGRTVSASFFDVLGVRPALGRLLRPDDDATPGDGAVAVLSHRFWRERFNAEAGVLGQTMLLNDTAFTVVGVADESFTGATIVGTDLWVPIGTAPGVRRDPDALTDAGAPWHMAIGRLRPDATRESAQAELATLLEAFKADTPAVPASHGIVVVPGGRLPAPVRTPFAAFAGLLLALTVGLLVVACSNVAGMLLARATARRREMAARVALGAGRGRLLRQMLTETLVLFAAAALAAMPLAVWLGGLLQSLLPALPMPVHVDLVPTPSAMLFAVAVSLLAALAFGLAPARHALAADLSALLHGHGSTEGPDRRRVRQTLVVAQVAMSLAIAITAGLLVRTLDAATRLDTGFRQADVEVVSIDTTLADVSGPDAVAVLDRVTEAVRAVGGVEAAGYGRTIPLQGGGFGLGEVRVPGASDAQRARLERTDWDTVSPGYLDAVGLALLEGRRFTADDGPDRPLVAVVNETLARTAWPGQSAIGRRFRQVRGDDEPGRPIEIVGVVSDARYRTLAEAARPFVYVPFAQHPQSRAELFVRHAPGRSPARDLRAAVARAEPRLPVVAIQSFDDATALGLLPQRLAATVTGGAAGVGVFLAALGLYGLVAFLVAQRSREIAIRIALGASGRDVRSMVLRQAGWLGGIGAIVGLAIAAGLAVAVERVGLLVGVRPLDPIAFVGLASAMAAVLLVASYVPARRAGATDPSAALRS